MKDATEPLGFLIGHGGPEPQPITDLSQLAALEGQGGRYRAPEGKPINVTIEGSDTATLRLTAEIRLDALTADGPLPMISGDLFFASGRDNRPASGFRLGGRENWEYSFHGALSHIRSGDTTPSFIAICTISHSRPAFQRSASLRGILELESTKSGNLSLAFTFLANTGSGIGIGHHWRTPLEQTAEALRKIHLSYEVHRKIPASDKKLRNAIRAVMAPTGPYSVAPMLQKLGIGLTIAEERGTSEDATDPYLFAGQIRPYLGGVPKRLMKALRTPRKGIDWSAYCLFAADFGSQANGTPLAPDVYGRAYGFDLPQDRFFSRFGMVVNAREIAENIAAAPEWIDQTDEIARVAYLLRFTVIHEFGHLLNMPHVWSRHRGHPLLGTRRPDALSWMNYAGRYPFGPAAGAALQALPNNTDAEKTRKRRLIQQRERQFYAVFEPEAEAHGGFDAAERAFIRHAPLDHIAQGGRTFLDPQQPAPVLRAPPAPKQSGLAILSLDTNGNLRPISSARLWRWRFRASDGAPELPYLPAAIAFRKPDGSYQPIRKRAENANLLQLIIHRINPRAGLLPPPQPETRVFTPASVFLASQALTSEGARQGPLSAYAPFPWLQHRSLQAVFGNAAIAQNYAVQAVLHMSRPVTSQILTLSIGGLRTHPRDTYVAGHAAPNRFDFAPGEPGIEAWDTNCENFTVFDHFFADRNDGADQPALIASAGRSATTLATLEGTT